MKHQAPWVYYALIVLAIFGGLINLSIPAFKTGRPEICAPLAMGLCLVFVITAFMYCAICSEWESFVEHMQNTARRISHKHKKPIFVCLILFPFIGLPIMLFHFLFEKVIGQFSYLIRLIKD